MSAPNPISVVSGTVARIEWERFHHGNTALILLNDGRIVRVHSQGLSEADQDHLTLTREGDTIAAATAEEPEPHVCRFSNRNIVALSGAKA